MVGQSSKINIVFSNYLGYESIYSGRAAIENPVAYCPRGNFASKFVEHFYLWYLYVRKYLPNDYHIYWSDCGSPISIQWLLDLVGEDYEILKDDSHKLDFTKKIHVRKWKKLYTPKELEDGNWGHIRNNLDWWQICYYNDLDFLLIDGDLLIGYDISKDFEGKDCWVPNFYHDKSSLESYMIFHRNNLFHQTFLENEVNFIEFIKEIKQMSQQNQHKETAEGGFYKNFNHGKGIEMSRPDLYVHDVDCKTLIEFLEKDKIENVIVDDYIRCLKKFL